MIASSLDRDLERFRAEHPRRRLVGGAGAFEHTCGGAGSGAVVLLHGGGSTAEATHRFALALAPSMRVVAIDWPETVHTVREVLDGIVAVLDAERIERASVVGFSMGGMLAQRLAEEHPARVEKLVLYVSMGPSARYAQRFRRHRAMLRLVPDRLLRWASRRAVAKWVAAHGSREPGSSEEVAFLAAQRRASFDTRVSKRSLLSDADVLIDFFAGSDDRPTFEPTRVMIIEAEHDRMVDDAERSALRARYPGAHVLTLGGADHFAGALAPASITDAIGRFLAP